ncbi:MAG: sulfite exporter TauE/SafE family protein [Mycobacteriales bacterium]
MDWWLTLAGGIIGVVVGMTGMGGGALMTPVLVLFFGIPPLSAVSNDLVVSAVMKPVGSAVHLRRGTVNLRMVGWLAAGSVPCAFCGVLISRALGSGSSVQHVVKLALGVALLVAVAGLVARAYVALVERSEGRNRGDLSPNEVAVRPIPTLLVGAVGGVIVGMTSVGSGSLIIVALLALYPRLQASSLVGTDLAQAVPLVLSAAIGHLIFGDFRFGVTLPLLLGCLPGVYLGARLSAQVPGSIVRRVLAVVLLASALKLFNVSNLITVIVLASAVVLGWPAWLLVRRYHRSLRLTRRKRYDEPAGPGAAPTRPARQGT